QRAVSLCPAQAWCATFGLFGPCATMAENPKLDSLPAVGPEEGAAGPSNFSPKSCLDARTAWWSEMDSRPTAAAASRRECRAILWAEEIMTGRADYLAELR